MSQGDKHGKRDSQQRRLSAALRENLKRRKAQTRARATPAAAVRRDPPHDSAEINEDE
jgi:hypothetical protein